MDRRDFLRTAGAGTFTVWTSSRLLSAQQAVRRLTDKVSVVDGGGSNVLAFATGEGLCW
jgi:hypothetical protein